MIFSHLWHCDPNKSRQLTRIQNTLTAEITLHLPNKVSDHLMEHGYKVGYHLYELHIERMCEFAYAQYLSGEPAMAAIRNFLHMHGVSEDDFSIETAYKRWQRWNISRNNQKKETQNQKQNSEIHRAVIPVGEKSMKVRLAKFIRRNFHAFLLSDGSLSESMVLKARIFFRYDIMNMHVREICSRESLSPATVYHHIHTFKQKIKLKELIAY